MKDALKYITNRYNISINTPGIHQIQAGRYKCLPSIFKDLGFKVGAEVGVHKGEWSSRILRRLPGLKLFLIDLWESYPGYKDFPAAKVSEAYYTAIELTKGFDVQFIKEWSHKAANQFMDESLDFVYLDANHTYEYVVQDLAAWAPKVKKGGIVCGHDYDDYSKSRRRFEMNVINAVNGWVNSYQISHLFILINNKGRSWMYVK